MSSVLNYATIRQANLAEWLDTFITIPTFSYNGIIWKGASEIVTQFNYAASKNFTLRRLPVKPTSPNFCPVIRWREGATVYRYKLWQTVGETLNENIYNGEKIGANFVIEIWNIQTDDSVSLATAINIATSIRNAPETSYLSLAPTEECVSEEVFQTPFSSDVTSPVAGAVAWWHNDTGLVYLTPPATWVDQIGGRILTSAAALGGSGNVVDFNNKFFVDLTGGAQLAWTGTLFQAKHVFIVFSQKTWTLNDLIFRYGNQGDNTDLTQEDVTPKLYRNGSDAINYELADATPKQFDRVYIAEIVNIGFSGFSKTYIYDLNSSVPLNGTAPSPGIYFDNCDALYVGAADMKISDIIIYPDVLTDANKNLLLQYFGVEYSGAIITFPSTQDSDIPGGDNS